MKNVLNYQTSEYDCGPVSFLNGVRYLFDREEIFPARHFGSGDALSHELDESFRRDALLSDPLRISLR